MISPCCCCKKLALCEGGILLPAATVKHLLVESWTRRLLARTQHEPNELPTESAEWPVCFAAVECHSYVQKNFALVRHKRSTTTYQDDSQSLARTERMYKWVAFLAAPARPSICCLVPGVDVP